MTAALRIGIDLGGTKIAAIAFGPGDKILGEDRIKAPRDDYEASIAAVRGLVEKLETTAGCQGSIGIGMPGSISPMTGLVQNSNSTWLNGRHFDTDLETALGRKLRFANDANCFALSEATDGAAAGARIVFGVILGTGCGGGLVFEGKPILGKHHVGGEWGHNPLPWPGEGEIPAPICWCGRAGCLELWLSGSGLERDHREVTGEALSASDIEAAAKAGEAKAKATLARHAHRLARGLSHVVNLVDPDVIVLGGGLSKMPHLYSDVPPLMTPFAVADRLSVDLRPPEHGDASGVRGAARLWDTDWAAAS
ncbi:MAG: ROK family protein [Parvibaculaceae bacterium]